MGKGVFAVESVYSTVQFPGHVITANEEAGGHHAARVGRGVRSSQNYWAPTTANAEAWIQATFDRLRAFDFIAIDRHNLGGHTVKLRVSSDGFSTYEEIFSAVVPSSTSGGAESLAYGAVTFDGAYLRRFDVRAGTAVRLVVSAMGADLRPRIPGLYVGLSWQPSSFFDRPLAPNAGETLVQPFETPHGWMGSGQTNRRRSGELTLRLGDFFEYDLAAYHIEGHFARNRPMWVIHDDEQAQESWLAVPRPGSRIGFAYERDWAYPKAVSLQLIEHEPLLRAA